MKILFCEHNSICEPGIIRAFRAMGHEIVFSINFVPVISTACHICNISYLCWIVDSPVIQLYSDTLFLHNNYVFIFNRTLYEEFYGRNPGHIKDSLRGCLRCIRMHRKKMVTGEESRFLKAYRRWSG